MVDLMNNSAETHAVSTAHGDGLSKTITSVAEAQEVIQQALDSGRLNRKEIAQLIAINDEFETGTTDLSSVAENGKVLEILEKAMTESLQRVGKGVSVEMKSRQSQLRTRFKLGITLTAVGSIATMLETAARKFTHQPNEGLVAVSDNVDPSSPQKYVVHFAPNSSLPFLNSLGLTGPEINHEAVVQVVVLGDSVAWGHGMVTKDKIPLTMVQMLKKFLNKIFGSEEAKEPAECINYGWAGKDTGFERKILEGILDGSIRYADPTAERPRKPDIAVQVFCLNDVMASVVGAPSEWAVLNSADAVIQGWVEEWNLMKPSEQWDERQWKAMNICIEQYRAIKELADKKDIPLVVVFVPYNVQVSNPDIYHPQRYLIEKLRELGFNVIDVLPEFVKARQEFMRNNPESDPEADDKLFLDVNHLERRGHEIVAWLLADELAKSQKIRAITDHLKQKFPKLSFKSE